MPPAATPASCCRALPAAWRPSSSGSGSMRARCCGRFPKPASNMCAERSGNRHAGRRSGRGGLAQGRQVDDADADLRHRPPGRSGPRRPDRRLAGRARARRAEDATTTSRRSTPALRSTSMRSTTRSGWRPRRRPPVRASSRRRRRSRSIPPACASGWSRPTAGCAPTISCSPAMSISASWCRASSGTLMPVWTYVTMTKPLGGRLADAMAFRGAISDTDLADNHYRIVGGDRLMWSGRATTWPHDPKRFAQALTADIREVYPQLGGIEIEHIWSGLLGNSLHRMPQIGELRRASGSPRLRRARHQHHRDGGRHSSRARSSRATTPGGVLFRSSSCGRTAPSAARRRRCITGGTVTTNAATPSRRAGARPNTAA